MDRREWFGSVLDNAPRRKFRIEKTPPDTFFDVDGTLVTSIVLDIYERPIDEKYRASYFHVDIAYSRNEKRKEQGVKIHVYNETW